MELGQNLKIDRTAIVLAARASTQLFAEPGDRWGLQGGIACQLEIRERFRDRAKILLRYFLHKLKPSERDRWFLPMPKFLSLAYYFIRPVRLVLQKMGRAEHLL
jgi:hypothetical protein